MKGGGGTGRQRWKERRRKIAEWYGEERRRIEKGGRGVDWFRISPFKLNKWSKNKIDKHTMLQTKKRILNYR